MKKDLNKDSALEFIRQQRRLISDKIKDWQTILDHMKALEDFYSGKSEQISLSVDSLKTLSTTQEYSQLTLSKAILKILDDQPDKEWTPPEMAEELKRGGVKSKSDNFKGTVSATLMRLASLNKVERIQDPGVMGSKYKKKNGGMTEQ